MDNHWVGNVVSEVSKVIFQKRCYHSCGLLAPLVGKFRGSALLMQEHSMQENDSGMEAHAMSRE